MRQGALETQAQKTNSSQQGSSFSLQLFQGTLDEALGSFQKSIHEDVRNLHIEVLRQFHMQEVCVFVFGCFFLSFI